MIPKSFIRDESCGRPITHFKPAIVWDYSTFERFLSGDLNALMKDMGEFRKHVRDAVGFFWDSNIYRFSNLFGDEFAFSLYAMGMKDTITGYDLSVWDFQGQTGLFHGVLPIQPGPERIIVIREALKISEIWTRERKIKCGGCGEMMSYEENRSHRYFAGIYCLNCWETKYKAIEAAENYN